MKAALLLAISRGLVRMTTTLPPDVLRDLLGIVAQGFEEFSDAAVKEREREKRDEHDSYGVMYERLSELEAALKAAGVKVPK